MTKIIEATEDSTTSVHCIIQHTDFTNWNKSALTKYYTHYICIALQVLHYSVCYPHEQSY